jgi:hypothetical protein
MPSALFLVAVVLRITTLCLGNQQPVTSNTPASFSCDLRSAI